MPSDVNPTEPVITAPVPEMYTSASLKSAWSTARIRIVSPNAGPEPHHANNKMGNPLANRRFIERSEGSPEDALKGGNQPSHPIIATAEFCNRFRGCSASVPMAGTFFVP